MLILFQALEDGTNRQHPSGNVNGVFFSDSLQTGVGMVLHDDQGEFVVYKTLVVDAFYDDEGEALGLFEALSWIRSLGLERIIVELDAKNVSDAMLSNRSLNSMFGDFISSYKLLIGSPQDIKINLVHKMSML
ncbi:hypothetical protein ACS0TY_007278 [Phlomoides rotata]